MSSNTNTLKKIQQKSAAKASLLFSAISSPARPEYKPVANESTFAKLPFIDSPTHGFTNASNWHMPPTEDYAEACGIGREYAAHFAQYLKDNPDMCGANSLGIIARDIDFENTSGAAGYWVGFFSHLEGMVLAQAQGTDVYSELDKANAFYADIKTSRAAADPAKKNVDE
jgi:hypothetical protein